MIRLLVLGSDGCGKTTYIQALTGKTTSTSAMEQFGMDYVETSVKLPDNSMITVQFWDTKQSLWKNNVGSFLADQFDGAIILFDLSTFESFSLIDRDIDYFHSIKASLSFPVIIIGNKNDLPRMMNYDRITKILSDQRHHYSYFYSEVSSLQCISITEPLLTYIYSIHKGNYSLSYQTVKQSNTSSRCAICNRRFMLFVQKRQCPSCHNNICSKCLSSKSIFLNNKQYFICKQCYSQKE